MIEIVVYGTPAPQGSKKFVGLAKSGRGILADDSKKTKPWREDVKLTALGTQHAENCNYERFRYPTERECNCTRENNRFKGPVCVEIYFTLVKPKSAPKRTQTWPDKKPDIDKLCRSTLDALVTAGTIEDDARVVSLTAHKVFPGEHTWALHVPGARIRVSAQSNIGLNHDLQT